MKTLQKTSEHLDIRLTLAEVALLCNALNEVLNGIEVEEFEARLGASSSDANTLLTELRTALPAGEAAIKGARC